MAHTLSRREFHQTTLTALTGAVLLRRGLVTQAFAARTHTNLAAWRKRLHQLAADLKSLSLSPLQWQHAYEALCADISLEDLLAWMDFERLITGIEYPRAWAAIRKVTFPAVTGLPPRLGGEKVFAYARGRATAPHGHNNMVSAHLILAGQFHVRTYHRLRHEEGHLVLKPSIDRLAGPGEVVTMSDECDNVHWFQAVSDYAYTLDVPITNVYPGKSYSVPANKYSMIWVDPLAGRTADGLVRARVITFQEAEARFAGGP